MGCRCRAGISPPAWEALAAGDAPRGRDVVFALDVAPDHSTASLVVAWKRADGASHVMLADHDEGVDWLVDRAASVPSSWGGRLVVEQTGTAGFPLPALERARVTVDPVSRRRHGNQPELSRGLMSRPSAMVKTSPLSSHAGPHADRAATPL